MLSVPLRGHNPPSYNEHDSGRWKLTLLNIFWWGTAAALPRARWKLFERPWRHADTQPDAQQRIPTYGISHRLVCFPTQIELRPPNNPGPSNALTYGPDETAFPFKTGPAGKAMNTNPPNFEPDNDLALRIDEACDQLESAWLSGDQPSIETYLGVFSPSEFGAALKELLLAEWEILVQQGESLDPSTYCDRFVEHADLIQSVWSRFQKLTGNSKEHQGDTTIQEDISPLPTAETSAITGDFELKVRLGEGAFGVVWKAWDKKLRRWVAVKIPKQSAVGPKEIKRFLREAHAAAQLRHPNIVAVHDIGSIPGSYYIVSDYIEGTTLDETLQKGPLSLDQAIQWTRQIAEALQHAHERGVIHRDLKPQNILIDQKNQPHVTDFGLARMNSTDGSLTVDGAILGTPAYMSPEQASGRASTADQRSDLFSLGAILFQMLTGKLPFQGDIHALLNAIVHEDAPPIGRFRKDLPKDLDSICQKCLEKEANRRYASALELADDLRLYQEGKPIKARPVSAWSRTLRWTKRKPVEAVLAGSAVLLLFGLLMSWVWWPVSKPQGLNSLAVLIQPANEESKSFAQDLNRRWIHRFSTLEDLRVLPIAEVNPLIQDTKPLEETTRSLKAEALLIGVATYSDLELRIDLELRNKTSGTELWNKPFQGKPAALSGFEAGVFETVGRKLGFPLTPEEDIELARRNLVNEAAYTPYLKARFLHARGDISSLKQAITLFENAIAIDPSFGDAYAGLATAHAELAFMWLEYDHYAMAKDWAKKALAMDENLLEAQVALGMVTYYMDHDWEAGISMLENVLDSDASQAESFACFIHAFDAMGQNDLSLNAVESAIRQNPTSLLLLSEKGCVQYYAHQFQRSIESYKHVRDMAPENAINYWGLGRAYAQIGELDQALKWLREGEGKPDGDWQGLQSELAYVLARSGRAQEARDILAKLQSRESEGEYIDPYVFAMIYLGLHIANPSDQPLETALFDALEKARTDKSSWLPSIVTAPKFDVLRSNEQFQSFIASLNFPHTNHKKP